MFGEEEEDEDGVTTLAGMFTSNHELPLLPPAQCRTRPTEAVEGAVGTGCDTADGGDDAVVEPDVGGMGWELNLHTANLSESERSKHIVAENKKI